VRSFIKKVYNLSKAFYGTELHEILFWAFPFDFSHRQPYPFHTTYWKEDL